MSQSLREYPFSDREACDFEVLSDNAEGIRCEAGIVTIPKSNFGHLNVDEHEFILMKFLEIERNNAEVPKTVLLNAKRTENYIHISGQSKHAFQACALNHSATSPSEVLTSV